MSKYGYIWLFIYVYAQEYTVNGDACRILKCYPNPNWITYIIVSVLQRVAACCGVLQCVAVCCSEKASQPKLDHLHHCRCVAACRSVLQRVAVCCGMLQ